MPGPFPGMDPWLEDPRWFPNLHILLLTATNRLLRQQLRPRGYLVAMNERVWVSEPGRSIGPDVAVVEKPRRESRRQAAATVLEVDEPQLVEVSAAEIREPYIEILDAANHKLVTGIEFLSPSNKARTQGRKLYLRKQRELLNSAANLVEIDLLRGGRHTVAVPRHLIDPANDWDYAACIARSDHAERFEVYSIPLASRLPRIRIPLKPGDGDGALDLQSVFDASYDEGPFADRVDYSQRPFGRMSAKNLAWCREVLELHESRPADA